MNVWWKKKGVLYNSIVSAFGVLSVGFEFIFLEQNLA